MTPSRPTRVDSDLWDAAAASASVQHRSIVQQINRWIRIGQALETSPGVNSRDIERVLRGDGSYDELSEREQAVVRAEWDEEITARRSALDLEAEFRADSEPWSEADGDGNLVARSPD